MKTNKKVRRICDAELTDVVAGPMKLDEIRDELASLVTHRSPQYMIVLIEKRPDLKKYYTAIYITHKDFARYTP